MPNRLPSDLPPATVDQGEFAYNTWANYLKATGVPLLTWRQLTPETRGAWTATAQAIIDARHDVRFVARPPQ